MVLILLTGCCEIEQTEHEIKSLRISAFDLYNGSFKMDCMGFGHWCTTGYHYLLELVMLLQVPYGTFWYHTLNSALLSHYQQTLGGKTICIIHHQCDITAQLLQNFASTSKIHFAGHSLQPGASFTWQMLETLGNLFCVISFCGAIALYLLFSETFSN